MSDRVRVVEEVAAGQFGLFAHGQATRVGVTRTMLTYHSRPGGRWNLVESGVYSIAGRPMSWQAQLLAAQLSVGRNVPLSHRAAAALIGLDGVDPSSVTPEFTGGLERRHDHWDFHRTLSVPVETAQTGPFLHTAPLRTIVDLGAVVSPNRLELALESALRLCLIEEAEVREAASDRRRFGARRLRAVLARRGERVPPTESAIETIAVQLIRRCRGVPTPDRQVAIRVDGRVAFRLDLAWAPIRLYLEIDGRAYHDVTDDAFQYERWRRRQLVQMGWAPAELTARDLLAHAEATAREIESLVSSRAREVAERPTG